MVRFIPVLSPRTRTLAPFGAAVLLALATIVLPPRPESWLVIGAAIALSLVLVLAAFAMPWKKLPGWAPATLPLLYFFVIALLRDAQGGSMSGYAPLCMLPVFWLALYGSRRQLALAIAAVAVIFVGPLLLGGSEYATSEWRRAILWVAIAGLVGFRVQALVADVKRRGRDGRMQAATLVQAEARTAEATAHSPIGIARAELDGTFLSVNPALCRFLGRAEESMLGRRGREFSHPDDLEGTAVALARLLSGAIPSLQEEKRYLRPDGTEVTLLLSMTLVRDADGVPSQLLAHFADVTAQKQAEQALRESEASLQAIARVARELSSSTDVRSAICEATLEVAGAASALIFEPDGGDLATSASAGPEFAPIRKPLSGSEASGAVSAYLSGRRIFIENAKTNPAASTRIAHLLDAGSMLYEPIVSRGKPIGVLVVVWPQQQTKLADRAVAAVGLLADEAAVALERDTLLARLNEQAHEDERPRSPTGVPGKHISRSSLPGRAATRAPARSPSSISTTSSGSTTPTAIKQGTSCSAPPRSPGEPSCGRPTSSPATGVRSSRSSFPAPTSPKQQPP